MSLNLDEANGGIVLMDDGLDPHYDTTTQHNGYKVKFEYADTERQYVVSKVFGADGHTIISRNLYYVENPYCSFIDTALKPIHGMMARKGLKDFNVNFLTLPLTELKNETEHSFYVQYKTESGETKKTAIPFREAEFRNFPVPAFEMIENVCKGLGMTVDDFLDKMNAISKLVMKNETLLSQIFELSKEYKLINSDTQYQTELKSRFPESENIGRIIVPSWDKK
ncbi:hypothetical protein WDU94_010419 [Cyamophila willieti]